MRAHRRPLVTAAVAGGLLCGLWFVPSANATNDGVPARSATSQTQTTSEAPPGDGARTTADGVVLANTGSFDTTPYLFGGLGFLGAGAVLLTHARIRSGRVGVTPVAR